ncbi:hypothetical protein J6590_042972 [Homalodisca vitripennis]|nr:hypothetical protein J6590_042972 [Homalodisca vitripennis]
MRLVQRLETDAITDLTHGVRSQSPREELLKSATKKFITKHLHRFDIRDRQYEQRHSFYPFPKTCLKDGERTNYSQPIFKSSNLLRSPTTPDIVDKCLTVYNKVSVMKTLQSKPRYLHVKVPTEGIAYTSLASVTNTFFDTHTFLCQIRQTFDYRNWTDPLLKTEPQMYMTPDSDTLAKRDSLFTPPPQALRAAPPSCWRDATRSLPVPTDVLVFFYIHQWEEKLIAWYYNPVAGSLQLGNLRR